MNKFDKIFLVVLAFMTVVGIALQVPLLQKGIEAQRKAEEKRKQLEDSYKMPTATDNFSADDTTASVATDSQTKAAVASLATYLEVYYNEHGGYPSAADATNNVWRSENLIGYDDTTYSTKFVYASAPMGCKTDSCTSFEISVILSNGEKYSKKSLN